jgi:hypothetical protein
MILDEMASFICGKVNQTEAEDIAACKGFLQRRHEMIWADALWKDSLVEFRQTLSPDGYTVTSLWLPTKGILLLPPIIDRVLAVRSDTRKLNAQRPEFFYRVDYDAFAKSGDAADYILLPPCAWETDSTRNWRIQDAAAADTGSPMLIDALGADGVSVNRLSHDVNFAGTFEAYDRIDRVLKPTTTNALAIIATLNVSPVVTVYNTSAESAFIGFSPTTDPADITVTLTVAAGAFGSVDAPEAYIFLWNPLPGLWIEPATGFNAYGAALRGVITWDGSTFTVDSDTAVITVAADAMSAATRQRVRLIEIPTAALTLRVLGKRTTPAFDNLDKPGLNGSENCLIAFAQGDMLERERQYAKATAKFQEGVLLLDQLKRVETVQQAHNTRIIPEGGYGDDDWNQGTRGIF